MSDTCLGPTVKLDDQSPRPQTPLPASKPLRLAVIVTLVPAGQELEAPQCTALPENPCQDPPRPGVDSTWMRFSSAALRSSGMEVLKRRSMGSPTPTVLPSPG